MNADKLKQLQIDREYKRRPQTTVWFIFIGVLLLAGAVAYLALPRESDSSRINPNGLKRSSQTNSTVAGASNALNYSAQAKASGIVTGSVLTVSGYIINRERIELSPRFMGVVKWIGVKKGDAVTNGQVVALLDDAEYRAQLKQAQGRMGSAKVAIAKAQLDYDRALSLLTNGVEMQKTVDDARLQLEAANAATREIEGLIDLMTTYLSWTVIKSPLNGVVIEKLVDPNELVTPQSFGGTRGPSTALIALADPKDLQVEIDLNESDISKIHLKQKCKVSPEAYPDKVYEGYVAEVAPEASRQKGTLQVKVQIIDPDKYLTPELSAKVDFLK